MQATGEPGAEASPAAPGASAAVAEAVARARAAAAAARAAAGELVSRSERDAAVPGAASAGAPPAPGSAAGGGEGESRSLFAGAQASAYSAIAAARYAPARACAHVLSHILRARVCVCVCVGGGGAAQSCRGCHESDGRRPEGWAHGGGVCAGARSAATRARAPASARLRACVMHRCMTVGPPAPPGVPLTKAEAIVGRCVCGGSRAAHGRCSDTVLSVQARTQGRCVAASAAGARGCVCGCRSCVTRTSVLRPQVARDLLTAGELQRGDLGADWGLFWRNSHPLLSLCTAHE